MDERDTLVADLDQELAATRLLLTRLPDASWDWQPHPKSFSLGALATHIARLPHWGAQILEHDAYDLATTERPRAASANSAEVLALFDRHVKELRHWVTSRPAAALDRRWSLVRGRETLLTLPCGAAVRRFCLQHLIHHRGQLTVYLRLRDVPLPPLYGPTADEAS